MFIYLRKNKQTRQSVEFPIWITSMDFPETIVLRNIQAKKIRYY